MLLLLLLLLLQSFYAVEKGMKIKSQPSYNCLLIYVIYRYIAFLSECFQVILEIVSGGIDNVYTDQPTENFYLSIYLS